MTRVTLAAALLASAAIAACGSSGNGQPRTADDRRALQFARCMRAHGVDMPDPTPGRKGGIEFSVGRAGPNGKGPTTEVNGQVVSRAHVNQALQACRKYEPNGGRPPSAAQQQEMLAQAVKFSRCMRAHGVDMPDPKPASGGGIMLGGPGSKNTFDPRSPRFQAAQKACQSQMPKPPGGGDSGPSLQTAGGGAP